MGRERNWKNAEQRKEKKPGKTTGRERNWKNAEKKKEKKPGKTMGRERNWKNKEEKKDEAKKKHMGEKKPETKNIQPELNSADKVKKKCRLKDNLHTTEIEDL